MESSPSLDESVYLIIRLCVYKYEHSTVRYYLLFVYEFSV